MKNNIVSAVFVLLLFSFSFLMCSKKALNSIPSIATEEGEYVGENHFSNIRELAHSLKNRATALEYRDKQTGQVVLQEEGVRLIYFGYDDNDGIYIAEEEVIPIIIDDILRDTALFRFDSRLRHILLNTPIAERKKVAAPLLPVSVLAKVKKNFKEQDYNYTRIPNDWEWKPTDFPGEYALKALSLETYKPPTPDEESPIIYVEAYYDNTTGKRKYVRSCDTEKDANCGTGNDCYSRCVGPLPPGRANMMVVSPAVANIFKQYAREDANFWLDFINKVSSKRYKEYEHWRSEINAESGNCYKCVDGRKIPITGTPFDTQKHYKEWQQLSKS